MDEDINNFENLTIEQQWIELLKIQDEDKRQSLISKIENEVERVYLATLLVIDDYEKIKMMNNMKDKRARMMLMASLIDEELKQEYIHKIH